MPIILHNTNYAFHLASFLNNRDFFVPQRKTACFTRLSLLSKTHWEHGKMSQKKIVNTAFQRAYQAWFSDYERTRKQLRRRRGAKIPDFPAPPTHPEDIVSMVSQVGRSRVLKVFGIHRSTLARWMTGEAVMPRPAWLLLVLMAEGRLPGMSDDWSQFRFDGDRLYIIGTRLSYSALEIAGWQYQQLNAQALARRVEALEKENAHLLRVGVFGSANDPLMATA